MIERRFILSNNLLWLPVSSLEGCQSNKIADRILNINLLYPSFFHIKKVDVLNGKPALKLIVILDLNV